MAVYDFKAAKKYIQMHSDLIESASLGMHQDWFWTAETVFEDGRFLKDLDDEKVEIGGIRGSDWATPVMEITFKDGSEITKDCYIGSVSGQKPEWLKLGCLSQPIQDMREPKLVKIN